MKNYLIFGAPGAGKGTQAALMAKKYRITHLSSGEILRREANRNGLTGKKIKACQDKGQLVPDRLIIPIMEKKIARTIKKGMILDGYPRTLSQAKSLDKFLETKKTKIALAINLKINQALSLKRLINRGRIAGRSDDKPETIKKRFAVYKEQTAPLLSYYGKQKKLIHIDGQGKIGDIFKNVNNYFKKNPGH